MERLTEQIKFPLDTFLRCQLCGFTDDDICEFRMWWECDDQDVPEPGNIIVTCKQDACFAAIDQHPRLYRQVPWGQGDPGYLMLLCGDCDFREGTACTHPDLRCNGGDGLTLRVFSSLKATVCIHDDTAEYGMRCTHLPSPFMECAGQRNNKCTG